MKYHFKVHKEGTGFWAQCVEIPGCVTQGDTKEELLENMKEAINLAVSEEPGSKELVPLPKNIKASRSVVSVPVDPKIAFGFAVRYHRIKKGLTQKQAAKLIGANNIYSYQRLEKNSNATIEMIAKILDVFPEFSMDRVLK